MFFYRMPEIVQWIYPSYVWHMNRAVSNIYLTFDDGPVKGITEYVLDLLLERNKKATFFMVGENILKQLPLARRVIAEGHQVGNHTFNHLNGRNTSFENYIDNVLKCNRTIEEHLGIRTDLFRPPYGRITRRQSKFLRQHYRIIMWEILSGDFVKGLPAVSSLKHISQKTQNGSILLFHDQIKTADFVKRVLPGYLDFLDREGFATEFL